MKRKNTVTPTLKELLEDMKPMTFMQKLDHLWSYYKEYLLLVFLLAVVVGFSITAVTNSRKESLLSGMMVNLSMSQKGYNYLSEDYFQLLEGDPKKEYVMLDYTNFEDLADPTNQEDNYNASLLLIARVTGELLDYALVDKMALEFYLTQEVFLNLEEFFTAEELEAMGDKVIYAMQEFDSVRWPIAVEVSELPFFQDNSPEEEEVYFTISGNNPDLEAVRGIWDHINRWQSSEE